ncbi:MAG: PAS domain-containing protein [Gemmatimonadetes bacterium]|nr:PAS domain-containing protein [Gemmatimonadota bacterium]
MATMQPPATADPLEEVALTVVGIGASAGGLKALQQFVEAVPVDSGMAYVVIMHLDPERESRMAELLQDRAAIAVTQVTEPVAVEANHIYMIPPGQDLTMRGGGLELRERGERADHAPVDLFFRTLAEACGAGAVGVILSGTGADGTAGIRYIREAGGITVVQSPDESTYDGMPASAISTGFVDMVLPSARIPGELVRLRQRPEVAGNNGASSTATESELADVFAALRSRTGHDFSMYRRSTVLRRLDRRLRFNDVTTLMQYQPLLETSAAESQALLRDLLISVSSFFRDPDAFDALSGLLPSLFDGKGAGDTVRVWVVGCATGEEVYSIAMVLAEHASTLADPPRLQLFATDIDEHGYAWARAGNYSTAAVAGIDPALLEKYFTREAHGYRIRKSLRELVLFACHNVLHDPPFSRMDLVSCRNFFIYLQPEAQERVLDTFHFATNEKGLLFLGASESPGDGGLFAAIPGCRQRLYRRQATPRRVNPRLSAADPQPNAAVSPFTNTDGPRTRFSYGSQHVRMLEQYAPASVIVNERLDAVHLSAGAGQFLRPSGGEPDHNVLLMASGEMRKVLRTALHHAFESRSVVVRQVRTEVDGERRDVRVHVRPTTDDGSAGRFALVIFETVKAGAGPVSATHSGSGPTPAEADMESELRRTRELLESTSEAHDRTVAELQTVNEELQSINEEQKAAGEELDIGREEIQSINEELTTINQEHQSTIEELKRTNEDLQNLIESTEIGTLFLDRSMRIRRYTPAMSSLFNFVATDQGRPLSHITHRLACTGLQDDVATVLSTLERIEREVESDTGEHYIMRINPYRSSQGTNEGAVLTFFDNTEQHRAREELRSAKQAAETANQAKVTFLSTLSHEFRTPLNGILGYADLLQMENDLSPSQEQKVARIRAGGWHLAAMIEEILSFAKLDGGHEVVEPARVDARAIAAEARSIIQPVADAKGLAFVMDMPETGAGIVTDAGKARQILINLCGNAVKYTETGEVRLRVRSEAGGVNFEVSDTGVGIAAEHLTRIFERFWQVNDATTRASGGMGIGLAAAREYAQLLGGDVQVVSTIGAGTTFRLWLPAAYERAD